MNRFVRWVDSLAVACAVAAAVLLFAAVLVVTWMVLYRAAGFSTFWELESAVYMMVAAVFLGSPYCLRTNGHVSVDLLAHYLHGRSLKALTVFVSLAGMVACVYLAWIGAELTLRAWHEGETSGSLWNPPRWPLYLTMPVGMGLTALQYVAEILRPSREEGAEAP